MRTLLHSILLSLLVLVVGAAPAAQEGPSVMSLLDNARNMIAAEKSDEALALLSSYHPSREEFSAYHYACALALVKLHRSYDSIEHYRLAYLYAGSALEKERLLLERAEVYVGMGYSSEAVVCFEVFLQNYPKSNATERVELGIAESRYHLGDFREALVHFDKAGSSLPARYGKANALQALGRTAEAREIYKDLIENDPEVINASQETLYNIGENYRRSGELGDAKIYFTSVKDTIIQYRAAIGLGLIAMQQGKFDDAVALFTTAAESPARLVRREAIMHRADAHMRLGKLDEAEAALVEIRNRYPYGTQFDTAVLLLAKLYRTRGKFNESVAALKTLIYRRIPVKAALDELEAIILEAQERDRAVFVKLWNSSGRWLLDPARAASLAKIAQGLRFTGKPFIDICSWLIRYGSEDAKSAGRLQLADFYVGMGDPAIAWGYIKRARVKGHSDEVLRIKARIFSARNEPINVSRAIMGIHELQEGDMLLFLASLKSKVRKDSDKEIQFCLQTFKKMPATPQVALRFADILYDKGRTGDALAYYKAAVATVKPGAQDRMALADREWAHYRISVLATGEDRTASLKAIQTGKDAVNRFAAAELKETLLRKRSNR